MLVKRYAKTKLVVVILIAFSINIFAQPLVTSAKSLKSGFTEIAIQNLAEGVKSDNAGLKKCSIYFAGFYEIKELVNVLVEQLKKEPDANTRILIALSLYKIGDKKGFEALEQLVKYDENQRVKNISAAILNQLLSNTSNQNIKLSEN